MGFLDSQVWWAFCKVLHLPMSLWSCSIALTLTKAWWVNLITDIANLARLNNN